MKQWFKKWGWLTICLLATVLSVILFIDKLIIGKQDFRLFGAIIHVILWSMLLGKAIIKLRKPK
jgi:hypothetical protein